MRTQMYVIATMEDALTAPLVPESELTRRLSLCVTSEDKIATLLNIEKGKEQPCHICHLTCKHEPWCSLEKEPPEPKGGRNVSCNRVKSIAM